MPMFYTPKPRQFHYEPRFYDPEKEAWEEKKRKYAARNVETQPAASPTQEDDIAYLERRVKELDDKEKRQQSKLGAKDLFRKREMPKFNPQFHSQQAVETGFSPSPTPSAPRKIKFRRRFDVEDPDSFKPVSAGKIFIYVGLVCLLLYWILN